MDFYEFMLGELQALLELQGLDIKKLNLEKISDVHYFITLKNDEIAINLMKRSVFLRGIVRIWASGDTYAELISECIDRPEIDQLVNQKAISLTLCSYGKRRKVDEKVEIFNKFEEVFKSAKCVDLTNPQVTIAILEDWDANKNAIKRVHIGLLIISRKDVGFWWSRYNLTDRLNLGPTTLDNELSFVMANLGLVVKNKIVLDPFVGSGGCLIAATHYGAICFGSDMDRRILNGWGCVYKNPRQVNTSSLDIFTNFRAYNMPLPFIAASRIQSSCWINGPWVDVIITDPPYGVRSSVDDDLSEALNVIKCLLDLSYQMLVDDGQLVFLLPVKLENINMDILTESKLNVVWTGLQKLTAGNGRVVVRLIKAAT